jgi:hypothetical protein
MPGLVPGIHAPERNDAAWFARGALRYENTQRSRAGVDGRDKPGHDDKGGSVHDRPQTAAGAIDITVPLNHMPTGGPFDDAAPFAHQSAKV